MSRYLWALLPFVWGSGCSPAKSTVALFDLGASLTIGEIEARLSNPLSAATIATGTQLRVGSLYQALVRDTDDVSFSIAGRVVAGVHSRLVAAAPQFALLNARYATLGEQMAASSVDLQASRPAAAIASDFIAAVEKFATTPGGAAQEKGPADTESLDASPAAELMPEARSLRNLAALAALAVAAGAGPDAALDLIVNPAQTCEQPSAAKVTISDQTGIDATCTGGFICSADPEHDYLLSAGHCFQDELVSTVTDADGNVTPALGNAAVLGGKAPGGAISPTEQLVDLAVLKFPAGTAKACAPLATTGPAPGSSVQMTGYGQTDPSDPSSNSAEDLHCGSNTYHNGQGIYQGLIMLSGVYPKNVPSAAPGERSSHFHGDSGGPLYNSKGQIVGVASSAALGPQIYSAYVPVTSATSQAFIYGATNGAAGQKAADD